MNRYDHGERKHGGQDDGEPPDPFAGAMGGRVDMTPADGAACSVPGLHGPWDFERVYVEHFDFACRSLRLLGVSVSLLEDAAQDVFQIVLRKLNDFEGSSSMKTWIFAIVQRVASNYRRASRRKQRPLQPLLEPVLSDEPSPEAFAEAAQAAARIQTFCEQLDESRRAVFVLALVEEVPAREVASALGIPLFTVYSRMRSLRAALQLFLERHEVAP